MTRSIRTVALLAVLVALARCSGCNEEEFSCPSGQVLCKGLCVDPASYQTDGDNCGGCGIECGVAGSCSAGACVCDPGATSCPENPRCADTQNDRLNCGGCGIACTVANETCSGGTCQCLDPFTGCGAQLCTNTQTDALNCGTCDHVCPLTNEVCVDGLCTCPAALPDTCGSTCVNKQTDAANCGTCDNTCSLANEVCVGGGCTCPGTLPDTCGSSCVNRQTDETNCGACSWVCPAGITCTSGGCPCPGATPRLCGQAGQGGHCCAGDGCCGSGTSATCQTQHSNGVGQFFYDCVPVETYDLAQAEKAAKAWQPVGTEIQGPLFGCTAGCIGWHATVSGLEYCGTWCYAGNLTGRSMVQQAAVCGCPLTITPNWN